MPAPAAIQKQIDKANEIHAQVYGEKTSEDLDVINNLPGAEPAEPPAEPTELKGGDTISPAAPAEAAGTTEDQDEDKFEHKYKVLQGKYNKEVPLLNEQVKDLQSELSSMRTLLASLENVGNPVETKPGTKLLKDEEVEDYGSDMIDVIKRAAREELMPTINRLEEENSQLRATLGGVSQSVAETSRDTLYRALNIEVPNWKEINQDSGFLEWLEGIDPYSGTRRGDMLTQAFDRNDAARTVAFFKGYLHEHELVTETPTPSDPQRKPQIDLMSMAAPGTPRGGSAPAAHNDKRVYSQADISAFYRDVQKGVFRNRQAEKEAIERDILLAGQEGRIR